MTEAPKWWDERLRKIWELRWQSGVSANKPVFTLQQISIIAGIFGLPIPDAERDDR